MLLPGDVEAGRLCVGSVFFHNRKMAVLKCNIVRSGLQALIGMILRASLLKIDALDCYFYSFIFLLIHSVLCPTILVQGLQ